MDTIDEALATNALSSKYSIAIHAALSIGKKTLNHYYEKTDFSTTYRIAMGILWFILHFIITYIFFQSFIPVISSTISRMQSGRTSGSRLPSSLYKTSLTFHTIIALHLQGQHQVTRYVLLSCISFIYLTFIMCIIDHWIPIKKQ